MAVIKNMLVRIGADASGFNGSMEAVKARIKGVGTQASEAAKETGGSMGSVKAAIEKGFDNKHIIQVNDQIKLLKANIKSYERQGFGIGYAAYDKDYQKLQELQQELKEYKRSLGTAPKEVAKVEAAVKSSDAGVANLLSSIRRVGIVSIGLNVARSAFSSLKSMLSGCIDESEELKAQTDGLKAGMAQALAPAVTIVTNGLRQLLPVVVGVGNAFGKVLGALFGDGWSVAAKGAGSAAKATSGAAAAQKEYNRQLLGFDQLTKLSKESSSTGGGGGSAEDVSVTPIQGQTPAWAERFKSSFTSLFESDEFKAANIGGKLGMTLQTGLDWLGTEFEGWDWKGAGTKLRQNLESFIKSGWQKSLFRAIGVALAGIGEFIIGYFIPDWESLKRTYREEGGIECAKKFISGLWYYLSGQFAVNWLMDNAINPMLDGFLDKFRKSGEDSGTTWMDALKSKITALKLPHLKVEWEPISNAVARFFGVTALPKLSINWYAKGGILDGAQIFGAMGNTLLGGGEAGREAVLPLDRNTDWMDNIAERVAQRLGGGGNTDALLRELIQAVYGIKVGDDVIGRAASRYQRAQSRALGGV